MKLVLLKPLWPDGLGGRLFDTAYPWSLQKWRQAAAEIGIALEGWDMRPLREADCVWFLDLTDTKKEYDEARRSARSGVPFVLQVMETPAGRSQNFHPANQALFDYVVTYQQHLPARDNLFNYRLPHGFGGFSGQHRSFDDRKCAVMVNSNRVEGWLAPRRPGLVGLPGVGPSLSGWRRPWWAAVVPAKGELYSWRRKFARLAATRAAGALEIYGPGWRGERISCNPFFERRPYPNCVSAGTSKKLDVIADYRFTISVENFRGRHDYISEKIFDPLIAGSVPVYLGDERVEAVVPREAFVDVRDFASQEALLDYLQRCPPSEWREKYDAGQSFLKSAAATEFATETFVAKMNEILKKVLDM